MTISTQLIGTGDTFVGRTHESAALLHQLELATGGQTRIVLLAGEPGIGKTCLLNWLAARAVQEGAVVLLGGASQSEGMPPYLPFLEALGTYIRTAPLETLREQAGEIAATLAVILPELASRLGNGTASYPLPPEQARLRLFEAVSEFLSRIAADRPLLLVLDDLQWADGASLDLLSHAARTRRASRLLIAGAYRSGEEGPILPRAVAELTRQRRLTTIRIGPLSPDETSELTSRHLDGPAAPDVDRLLYEQSEGNPFFAEELLRGWLEMGALRRDGDHWSLAPLPDDILPASIVAAVEQRLARLDAPVVESLRVASIIGRVFQASLLANVTNRDPELVEEGLAAARQARLIDLTGDEIYSFCHDRIRECLYAQVPGTKRRRLHEAIGRALEESNRGQRGSILADLAFHFARSGDRERGLAYSRRAGDEAVARFALDQSLGYYQTALDLISPDDERRGQILLDVGQAALLAGKEQVATGAFAIAQGLLADGDPIGAGRAAHGLGLARLRQDAQLEARVAFEAALELLHGRDEEHTVQVLVDLATLLCVNFGRQEEGIARGQEALALARSLGSTRLEAMAGRALGNLYVRGNAIGEGVTLIERALVLAHAGDDPVEAAECCACLANATYWLVDLDRSREYTVMRDELARRCQQPYELRHVYTWLAFLAATQGNDEEAERMLARALPIVEHLTSNEPLAFLREVAGFLALERGEYQRAQCELEAAVDIFRERGPGAVAWYLGVLGVARLRAGRLADAAQILDELDTIIGSLPPGTMLTAPALTGAMMMATQLGSRERAARYYEPLSAFSGQLHWFLVDPALAAFHVLMGDREAAEEVLARAEETARRAGMARALVGITGDRTRLSGFRGNDTPMAPLPGGISRREAEVLRLVAAGMSNRDIARALYLSENTVAKHLTSIFNKTGSENRAAAASFATRHGLGD